MLVIALAAGSCRDASLDLTEPRLATATTPDAGDASAGGRSGAGGDGMAGEAGAGGESTEGGRAGAESAFFAPEYCREALGECVLRDGALACTGDVGDTEIASQLGERARILIDMVRSSELRVVFEVCDPAGYVLNIGDSSTNNGGGGDWGQFEHDAEILLYDSDLTASSSDLGYERTSPTTGYHPLLLARPDYVSKEGCSVRGLILRDQYIADAVDPSLRTQSPTALRINPSHDAQGQPDALWYLGVNQVASIYARDRVRSGAGLRNLRLCFTVAPPGEPPRSGP